MGVGRGSMDWVHVHTGLAHKQWLDDAAFEEEEVASRAEPLSFEWDVKMEGCGNYFEGSSCCEERCFAMGWLP